MTWSYTWSFDKTDLPERLHEGGDNEVRAFLKTLLIGADSPAVEQIVVAAAKAEVALGHTPGNIMNSAEVRDAIRSIRRAFVALRDERRQ